MFAILLVSILSVDQKRKGIKEIEDELVKDITNITIVPEKSKKPSDFSGGFIAAIVISAIFGIIAVIVAIVSTIIFVKPLIAEHRYEEDFEEFSE